MHPPITFDPLSEAREFREQLSSDKRRVGFLFGAGTSQAVGIEGIGPLTARVGEGLTDPEAAHYTRLLAEQGPGASVETVLDKVRLCRELLANRPGEKAAGLSSAEAIELDRKICTIIYGRVSVDPPEGIAPHIAFASFLRSIARAHPVEIFTTNYDVLIERGLEETETPHFDGFVGTYLPRFSAASVEAESGRTHDAYSPPVGWVRVWKLHGSITWRVEQSEGGRPRLVRCPHRPPSGGDDLMIFPSREKYSESRKLPFVAYQDRLRRFLASGETLLVTSGYSFGDEHINEVIFEGLRWNNRLAVTALIYGDVDDSIREKLLNPTEGCNNLTVYGSDKAVVGGVAGSWTAPANPADAWPFWDAQTNQFTLGGFTAFAEYLRVFLGVREYEPGRMSGLASNSNPSSAPPVATSSASVPTPAGAASTEIGSAEVASTSDAADLGA